MQSNILWNVRQLSRRRTKGHEGTKPRDWCQRPRSNFSWETSSAVSEAATENLPSGSAELEAQQTKMTEATTKLLSVVSETEGEPWTDSPGLTDDLMSQWLRVQEDQGEGLRDKVVRKLARSWLG